jgi:tetratricopeptide (TPR) repeat protein
LKSIDTDSKIRIDAYINLGQTLIKNGEYSKIIKIYKSLIKQKMFPEKHDIFKLYLARSYLELNLYSNSEKELKDLIDGEYSNIIKSNAFHYMGLLNIKLNSRDIGIKQIEKAIELNPNNPDPYISVAIEFSKDENYDKAKRYFKESLSLNSKNAEVYHNLGHIYQIEGKPDKAINLYNKALKINNELLDTHFRLATSFINKENFSFARYHLNKLQDTDPSFINAKKYFGQIYMLEGSFRLAISELEKSLTLFPNDHETLYLLSIAYGNENNYKDSLKTLLKLEKLNNKYHDLYAKIGDLYLILQNKKKAGSFYKRELSRNPKSATALIGIMKLEALKTKPSINQITSLLKKAVSLGFKDIDGIKTSPSMKNVLKNKNFNSFLNSMDKGKD